MKRQIIAVALGSLFALPAFADGEIGFEYWKAPMAESSKTRAEVLAELISDRSNNNFSVDGETGNRIPRS